MSPVLHDELTVEILSRLPVKDLMRFGCISKSFNSLVFDPSTVKLHLQRAPRDTPILFTQSTCLKDDKPVYLRCTAVQSFITNPFSALHDNDDAVPFDPNDGGIVGACNGLLCLQYGTRRCKMAWVQFWNPATRLRSTNSPSMPVPDDVKMGFGYDESTDTYKVVAVLWSESSRDYKKPKIELRVHNLGDNCWREIAMGDDCPTSIIPRKGEFVNGTVNWVAQLASKKYVVFSFDVKNETYQFFSLPAAEWFGFRPMLGVFGGCLCLSHLYSWNRYGLWQMTEFGNPRSWTLLMTVANDDHLSCLGNFPYPLCLSENNDVLLLINNNIHQLTRQNRTRDGDPERFDISHNRVFLNSTNYVRSLVLPYRS